MSCTSLHHIGICVQDELKVIRLLQSGFGFTCFAFRKTPQASSWVLRSGGSIFVVTKRSSDNNFGGTINKDAENHNLILNEVNTEDISQKPPVKQFQKNSFSTEKQKITIDYHTNSNCFENYRYDSESGKTSEPEHWTVFCCQNFSSHTIDSVFNVALTVKDVDSVTERVQAMGGKVLIPPTNISDSNGYVRYSVVRSCCGNIVHTLIDQRNYNGDFLPGYETIRNECKPEFSQFTSESGDSLKNSTVTNDSVSCNVHSLKNTREQNIRTQVDVTNTSFNLSQENTSSMESRTLFTPSSDRESPLTTYIDHVTFVCDVGESDQLLSWYENCFGMKRFMTNREESLSDGFVLGGSIGIRLKAMEYWKCAESGLIAHDATMGDSSLKLVIAEPLTERGTSHVDTFLQAHKGPGIQHIGLHTTTMTATVKHMTDNGIVFRKPPPTYYQKDVKLGEIEEAGHGHETDLFRELGILLDTEADIFTELENQQGRKSYLMQVFTGPLFEEDTFFLEVIQRCGARGFGAGNIKALAKSILFYNQQCEKSK